MSFPRKLFHRLLAQALPALILFGIGFSSYIQSAGSSLLVLSPPHIFAQESAMADEEFSSSPLPLPRRFSSSVTAPLLRHTPIVSVYSKVFDPLRNLDEVAFQYLSQGTLQELSRYASQGSLYASGVDSSAVALTFDDGPSLYTPQVLATLRRYHIHATFFVTGQNASRYPDLIREAIADGNVVGNHSFDHPHLAYLGAEEIRKELDSTSFILKQITGTAPSLFRPPYGSMSPIVLSLSKAAGYTLVLWSVSSADWDNPGVATIATRTVSRVRNGAIILLHDAGGYSRAQTVAALPAIIEILQARGYRFVTVPELIHPR